MKTYTLEQFKKFANEIEAYENGEEVEVYDEIEQKWIDAKTPRFVNWNNYRIKTKSREEITANWVKENSLKIGDKVKILRGFENNFGGIPKGQSDTVVGEIGIVSKIRQDSIYFEVGCWTWQFPVECLEKVKEEYVPFTYEDRDLFRGAWVKNKEFNEEYLVTYLNETKIGLDNTFYSYQDLFNRYEFLDGTPFGKLITK